MNVSVLCVQFCPVYKDPQASMEKVSSMLANFINADIVVLPEMAFPGYTFDDIEDIRPYLELPNSEYPTFRWCRDQAQRLGAHIFCGYPEKYEEGGYNSMMVLNPQGVLIKNYRKHHLYVIDKNWSREGEIFDSVTITVAENQLIVGLGICMDINPYEFRDYDLHELADFWQSQNVDLCAFCTNWTYTDGDELQLLNYWLWRLEPLLKTQRKVYFLAADRIGEEKGTKYSGASCVIELSSKPRLLGMLERTVESVLLCNIRIDK
ncbi:unnamed protein product [Blepharisma stoltei]|uniref:CN hydrolase domain-containing protein n=1 Tax=Blepharisma stoltei TaxID=1481888 RepID=A0AAU9J6Z2_9CILI|nr:unnamed protein product [Blepharisma stoltei]